MSAREGATNPLLLPPLEGHGRVSCTHSALITEVAHTARLNLLFWKGASAQHFWFP